MAGIKVSAVTTGEMPAERKLTSKGLRRRNEILDAAADLFDRHGYHDATIALIAKEIDSTKANIYHYFRAKHDILLAIHQAWIDDLILQFDETVAAKGDVEEQVRAIVYDVLHVVAVRRSQVRVYFEFLRELPAPLRQQAEMRRDEYSARVEAVFVRGIETGAIRSMSPRVAAFSLFGIINWTYQWYRPDGAQSPEEMAEQIFGIFWRGVVETPSESGRASDAEHGGLAEVAFRPSQQSPEIEERS